MRASKAKLGKGGRLIPATKSKRTPKGIGIPSGDSSVTVEKIENGFLVSKYVPGKGGMCGRSVKTFYEKNPLDPK